MGSNNKIPFNPKVIRNGMNIVLRKDGTVKSAFDRQTGEPIPVDQHGNRL